MFACAKCYNKMIDERKQGFPNMAQYMLGIRLITPSLKAQYPDIKCNHCPEPVLIGELDTCITGPDGEHACYANGNECLCACNQCRIEAEPTRFWVGLPFPNAENKSMVMEGQIAYQKILFDQYRAVCQEIFNQQIPVAEGCDKLTFISQQLDHIEKQYGIDWRTITQ